jgi:hypothetical protein
MPSATATTVPKFAATQVPSGSAATKSGVLAGVSEPVKNLHLVQMMAIDEEGCGSINPEITDQHRTQRYGEGGQAAAQQLLHPWSLLDDRQLAHEREVIRREACERRAMDAELCGM